MIGKALAGLVLAYGAGWVHGEHVGTRGSKARAHNVRVLERGKREGWEAACRELLSTTQAQSARAKAQELQRRELVAREVEVERRERRLREALGTVQQVPAYGSEVGRLYGVPLYGSGVGALTEVLREAAAEPRITEGHLRERAERYGVDADKVVDYARERGRLLDGWDVPVPTGLPEGADLGDLAAGVDPDPVTDDDVAAADAELRAVAAEDDERARATLREAYDGGTS